MAFDAGALGDGLTRFGSLGSTMEDLRIPGPNVLSAARRSRAAGSKNPGDDLFSRKAALSVSSALESLTSVFGMGTGMASPLESPGFVASGRGRQRLDAWVRERTRRGARKKSSISWMSHQGSDHDPSHWPLVSS